jgi:hypothetical protein
MPQSTLSGFTSRPPTIDLEVPTELQRTNDIASNTTASLTEEAAIATTAYPDCDFDRLRGYTELRDDKVLTSHVWVFGYRMEDRKLREHWICRICHTDPLKPRVPSGHYYYAGSSTTKALEHLRRRHRITATTDRSITMDQARSLTSSTQQSISSFQSTPKQFDFEVFKGLVL